MSLHVIYNHWYNGDRNTKKNGFIAFRYIAKNTIHHWNSFGVLIFHIDAHKTIFRLKYIQTLGT